MRDPKGANGEDKDKTRPLTSGMVGINMGVYEMGVPLLGVPLRGSYSIWGLFKVPPFFVNPHINTLPLGSGNGEDEDKTQPLTSRIIKTLPLGSGDGEDETDLGQSYQP